MMKSEFKKPVNLTQDLSHVTGYTVNGWRPKSWQKRDKTTDVRTGQLVLLRKKKGPGTG